MLSPEDISKKQIMFLISGEDDIGTLRLKNDNIVVEKDGKIHRQASCYKLLAVFIVGEFSISSNILRKLKEFGVSVFFMKQNCNCWGSIEAFAEGNFLLRAQQYRVDEEREFEIAKLILHEKFINQVLLAKSIGAEKADIRNLKKFIQADIDSATDYKSLLGIEGNYSRNFYKIYFADYDWKSRKPQIKHDITNFLMDIGYTYLFNITVTYLKLFGFDVYKGVYHRLFFQRKSLACDIMEPFRCLVDRQIRNSYNLGQIDPKDFKLKNGEYSVSWDKQAKYSKIFLELMLEYKVEIFTFVRDYYRFFMRPESNPFPKFTIK
jgi:CRISPR-associated protein Cas1